MQSRQVISTLKKSEKYKDSNKAYDNVNYTAVTFFNVIHEKSLRNMGIEVDWSNIPKMQAQIETAFNEIGGKHYTAICLSAEGLYHLHDVVTYEKARRRNAVSKDFGNCHVEEMRGTKEQAEDYIQKRGKFEEKGELILATFGNIENIQNNSGKRTDLANFDALCMTDNFNINDYLLLNVTNEREERYLEKRYARIMTKLNKKWRNVNVIYVEGEAGAGKSRNAFERYPDAFKASVADKTSFPFNGYHGEKVLWLDELRAGVFTHAELMQILDGYPLNVDVKYGQFPACWDTVLITTAYPFNDWYSNDKFEGNENKKAQFQRRIKERYIAENGEWIKIPFENGKWHEPAKFVPISKESDIPFT